MKRLIWVVEMKIKEKWEVMAFNREREWARADWRIMRQEFPANEVRIKKYIPETIDD